MALDMARHEDPSTAGGQHLFHDRVADVGCRIHFDAGLGELSLVRLHNACCVPRWVHRRRLDAGAVRMAGIQLVSETCRANWHQHFRGKEQ